MPSLYNKYRPKHFKDIIEQESIVTVLKNSVELKQVAHAYLFCGPKGTGKTTMARIFAKAINCVQPKNGEPCGQCPSCKMIESNQNLDITEIDAASHTGVDNIRELTENIRTSPASLKYKVYVIDEVHMLSKGAFNALLKSLEEPPEFVIFILATTEIHKVPATIISRCQRFNFRRLQSRYIIEKLKMIASGEAVDVSPGALNLIAASAEGGMRDAESLFDQIINLKHGKIKAPDIESLLGVPNNRIFFNFTRAVLNKDLKLGFDVITKLVYSGYDMNNFLKNLIEYLRDILILKIDAQYKSDLIEKMDEKSLLDLEAIAIKTSPALIGKTMVELIQAKNLIKDSPLPQIPIELALTKLIAGNGDIEAISPKNQAEEKPEAIKIASKQAPKPEKIPQPKQTPKTQNPPKRKKSKDEPKNKLSMDQIYRIWPRLILEVKKHNRSLWAVIQNCQPMGIDDDNQILVKTQYAFHKSKLEDRGNKELVSRIAGKLLASPCAFCYLLESEISPDFKKDNKTTTQQVLNEFGGQII
ncbi:MAG: DNA polymerase III subunit gamma/tau [Patescibacteria group bacterium]|nr:DNA polymerase III subunit gamma/tau [Patescibacteria group bacterium]